VVAYDAEATGTPKPLYLAWVNIDLDAQGNPAKGHVMVATSMDNGVTFSPTNGRDVSGPDGNFFIDKPWITASNGQVYVTYARFGPIGTPERIVVSTDGGATWNAPRDLSTLGAFNNFGQVAIATATGDVFATWQSGGSIAATRWLRSAGESWFESEITVPMTSDVLHPSANAVARDGSRFWIVWDAGTADAGNVKAAVAESANVSARIFSFGAPVVVNDDTACGRHILSTVAVDGAGIGHVLWIDDRYSTDIVEGVVHYASSTDPSGTTFSQPVAVSDTLFPFSTSRVPGLWLGDYIGIAVSGSRLYAAWSDPRSGRSHFRLSSRPLP
jgi:hypothetical protein